jgi:hypothetical protein
MSNVEIQMSNEAQSSKPQDFFDIGALDLISHLNFGI